MTTATAAVYATRTGLLARNTIWNVLGQIVPMAAGILAIPPLLTGMGVSRFGVLTLIWTAVGYFSLFDFGLGRALTKLVTDRMTSGEEETIAPLVWSSILLMLLLGSAAGLGTCAAAPWLVGGLIKAPSVLQQETRLAFYLVGCSIPIVTVTSGLRGFLEAQQRFLLVNAVRIPMSIITFAGPLLTLRFFPGLVPAVAILLSARVMGLLVYLLASIKTMPVSSPSTGPRCSSMPLLLRLGAWMTVSNVVSPLMCFLDRFIIGEIVSIDNVAYYTVPFDAISRITIIASAVMAVIFPAFAASFLESPKRTSSLLIRGVTFIYVAVLPILLVTIVLAPEALRLWLGHSFAVHSTATLRWLAIGAFINALAQAPFSLIHGAGRPDLTARLHLVELPIYLAGVWALTKSFGIEGAAIAWTLRVNLDAVLLCILAQRILASHVTVLPRVTSIAISGLSLLCLASFPQGLPFKAVFLAITLAISGLIGWRWLSHQATPAVV